MTSLSRPLALSMFADGGVYTLPAGLRSLQTKFSQLALDDSVIIKTSSVQGYSDFERFVRLGKHTAEDIRSNERLEKYENLEKEALARYPEFRRREFGLHAAHYLIVHKLQHERLRGQNWIAIPETRFVLVNGSLDRPPGAGLSVPFFVDHVPAIVQERVQGTSLWDMIDPNLQTLRPEWKPLLPMMSTCVSSVLASKLRDHLNWNIKNFLVAEDGSKIFYVDSKPSTMFTRSSNEHNIKGVKSEFLLRPPGPGGILSRLFRRP